MPGYILALNCGSSSIKSKVYRLPLEHPAPVASVSISNIGSSRAVSIKVKWQGNGNDNNEDGPQGDKVHCKSYEN